MRCYDYEHFLNENFVRNQAAKETERAAAAAAKNYISPKTKHEKKVSFFGIN